MWAICRRAWESSWELLCSPCSWHSEHPTVKWKWELLPACIGARLQTTQRDTWKLQHHLCCYPVHFSMTWLLGVLDFTSGAESAVAPNVTTLLMTHAAIPAFYICFAQVQMPTVRYQTTKNENQSRFLSIIHVSWRLSWGDLFQCLLHRKKTQQLSCWIPDFRTGIYLHGQEKPTYVLGYLYFTRRTSQYHNKEGPLASRSYCMYNPELYLLKNKLNQVNEYLLVRRWEETSYRK